MIEKILEMLWSGISRYLIKSPGLAQPGLRSLYKTVGAGGTRSQDFPKPKDPGYIPFIRQADSA